MDIEALERFLADHCPQARAADFRIAALDDERIVLALHTTCARAAPSPGPPSRPWPTRPPTSERLAHATVTYSIPPLP